MDKRHYNNIIFANSPVLLQYVFSKVCCARQTTMMMTEFFLFNTAALLPLPAAIYRELHCRAMYY